MNKFLLTLIALASVFFLYRWFNGPVETLEVSNTTLKEDVSVSSSATHAQLIIGNWQNDTDPNMSREFKNDGSAVDVYQERDNSDKTFLSWSISNEDNPDKDFLDKYESGVSYLRLDNGRDFIFLKIVNLDETKLQLIYLDEPGAVSFTRKQ